VLTQIVAAEAPNSFGSLIPFSGPVWAALLLICGLGLLAGPMLRRRYLAARQTSVRHAAPHLTLEQRAAKAASITRERDALDAAAQNARESIRDGCLLLDERIARLEKLLARAEELTNSAESETSRRHSATSAPTIHVRPMRIAPAQTAHPIEDEIDPTAASIYRLSDAGRTPLEIASELGEHTGKVQLVLALRGRATAAQS